MKDSELQSPTPITNRLKFNSSDHFDVLRPIGPNTDRSSKYNGLQNNRKWAHKNYENIEKKISGRNFKFVNSSMPGDNKAFRYNQEETKRSYGPGSGDVMDLDDSGMLRSPRVMDNGRRAHIGMQSLDVKSGSLMMNRLGSGYENGYGGDGVQAVGGSVLEKRLEPKLAYGNKNLKRRNDFLR